MQYQQARQPFDEDTSVNPSTLSNLALLGWLGAHWFYVGHDVLGALYFALLVAGIVFTVYMPFWIAVVPVGLIILVLPFLLSILDFFRFRRMSTGEIHSRYRRSHENQTIVFVAQIIFLVLLFIPLISRAFS